MDEKKGTYIDSKEVLKEVSKIYPYFRIEPGRDDFIRAGNEFAHPSVAEAMSSRTLDFVRTGEAQVNPWATKEELQEMRAAYNEASKENWERINAEHPEFEEYGYWEEYEVDGCPEEPDAPKVRVLVRRLRESFKKGPYPVVLPISVGGLFVNSRYMSSNAPITKYFGCQLVVPEIRTYPDAEYPAAINDLHATYQWMIQNAEKLQIDTDRIVIEGLSSGGHLAAALPFRLKRYNWCGGPMPRGIATLDGHYDDRESTRSMRQLGYDWNGLVNRGANMRYMGTNFASGFIGPEAYANHATIEECKGLPPYAIYVNQDCPSCDPTLEFMHKLNEAGVYCSLYMGGGCTHETPPEMFERVAVFMSRETDYTPTPGNDWIARMETFFIGNIRDFLEYDLRRIPKK